MSTVATRLDVLTELVNIGVGRAAAALSDLVGHRVELRAPSLTLLSVEEFRLTVADGPSVELAVMQDFHGGIDGRAVLGFPRVSAVKLGQLLSGCGGDCDDLTEDLAGVLEEVGNIVLNGVLGTFGNVAECPLDYSVPRLTRGRGIERAISGGTTDPFSNDRTVVLADTRFAVAERNIEGSLMLVFDLERLDPVVAAIAAKKPR